MTEDAFSKAPFEKPMTLVELVDSLTVAIKAVHDLQAQVEHMRGAFTAGVRYHDALVAMRAATAGDERVVITVDNDDELELLFVDWHNAIAAALGVEP
jgi:hypothetical protein